MYNIYYNNYEVYIGYIQLSEEVLQKYHPRVIFLQVEADLFSEGAEKVCAIMCVCSIGNTTEW